MKVGMKYAELQQACKCIKIPFLTHLFACCHIVLILLFSSPFVQHGQRDTDVLKLFRAVTYISGSSIAHVIYTSGQ